MHRGYAVNGLNQCTSAGPASFSYDANGNLTGDGANGYTYDVENRLISASNGTSLSYDPLGRLWGVAKAGAVTRFLYDGDQLTAEYDGAGNLLRRGDGADDPQVWYEGAGTTSPRHLYADHQGSVVAVADANGNALAINAYDEYGIPKSGNVGRFQYTGQAWLAELGLYHYEARVYSPTLGRFLQTDPIGYDDQINLYAYVANDPVNKTDSSGMCWACLKWAGKIILKGGDVAATTAGVMADVNTLRSPTATVAQKASAVLSLASEVVSPVSVRDAKAAKGAVEAATSGSVAVRGGAS